LGLEFACIIRCLFEFQTELSPQEANVTSWKITPSNYYLQR